MMKFSDADLQAVRTRSRLVDLVSDYVEMKKAGPDRLMALCPFPEHDERTPSFSVKASENLYYCHGCQRNGDAVRFVQEMQALTFPEAIEVLADRFEIRLTPVEDGVKLAPNYRKLITTLNAEAHEFFQAQLLEGADSSGRDFIAQRGYDLTEAVERFGMGYAPRGGRGSVTLLSYMTSRGHKVPDLVRAGLIRLSPRDSSPYDFFRGRPTWAIRDSLGRILGFGARRIHDDDRQDSKFVNTSETDAYKKTHVLYGIDFAKRDIAQRKQAIIVEGYMDVMATHKSGLTNATAACGTSLTIEHLSSLAKVVGTEGEIIFLFDGDAAGQKALFRAYETTRELGVKRLSALIISQGMDPDDLLKRSGPEAVRALLTERIPLIEATLRRVISLQATETIEDRVVTLDAVAKYLLAIDDIALREHYAEMVAGLLDVAYEHVATRAQLGKRAIARQEERKSRERIDEVVQRAESAPADHARQMDEQRALQLALLRPNVVRAVPGLLTEGLYTHPVARDLLNSIRAWAGHDGVAGLYATAPEGQRGAISLLANRPFDISDDAVESYARALFARLNLALLESQIKAQEEFLDGDVVNFDLLDKLQEMKRERDDVRRMCA